MINTKLKNIVFEPRHNFKHIPDKTKLYDVVVIGMGVAGYSSSMYASRLGLKVLILGEQPGGTLALTGKIENYPGFVSINGQDLTTLMENHALDYNVDVDYCIVENIEQMKYGFKIVTSDSSYKSKTVIFATGSKVRQLGIKGETEFFGKGVGYCALCDAAFLKGKTVAVIGGGDSAVKEAILITEFAKKVIIINNESKLHPEECHKKILFEKVKLGKIEVINENEVLEISGRENVENLTLKNKHLGRTEIKVQGVFVYVGRIPNSNVAKLLGVKLNIKKEIVINEKSQTNMPGFFAAGDVTNIDWKQAIIGVSQGVTASYYAYHYINNLK